jgi:hypothetical protein
MHIAAAEGDKSLSNSNLGAAVPPHFDALFCPNSPIAAQRPIKAISGLKTAAYAKSNGQIAK